VDPALKSAVFDAMQKLAAATLTTPFDGVVLAVHVKPGEGITPGQPILHLADPDAVEVVATVIEEDLPLVQVGQQVDLYFDAVPEASVRGRVARIVPQRTSDERPLYPIYIAMDEQPNGLLPGMTADGAIVVDERQDVLQLPRSMLPTRTDGTTEVEIWRDGRAEKRTIRVGLRGDVYAEIVDGLEEGDLVVGQ
jgi:HlyD family secretion protein